MSQGRLQNDTAVDLVTNRSSDKTDHDRNTKTKTVRMAGDQRQPSGPGLCGFGQRGQGALDICKARHRRFPGHHDHRGRRSHRGRGHRPRRGHGPRCCGHRTPVVAVVVVVTLFSLVWCAALRRP